MVSGDSSDIAEAADLRGCAGASSLRALWHTATTKQAATITGKCLLFIKGVGMAVSIETRRSRREAQAGCLKLDYFGEQTQLYHIAAHRRLASGPELVLEAEGGADLVGGFAVSAARVAQQPPAAPSHGARC